MSQTNRLEPLLPLSPEDQFLLELLVDGELDDPSRRDLLLKLDRIDGGWRCCAVAFLEAQSLREAVAERKNREGIEGSGRNDQESRSASVSSEDDRLAQTVFVSVHEIPDVPSSKTGGISDSPSAGDSDRDGTSPAEPSALDRTDSDDPIETAKITRNADEESDPFASEVAMLTADDPMIFPIKRGGFSRSRLHRRLERDFSQNGVPFKTLATAIAGGFLLATVTLGVLGSIFLTGSDYSWPTANNSPTSSTSPTRAVPAPMVAQSENRPSTTKDAANVTDNGDPAGRLATTVAKTETPRADEPPTNAAFRSDAPSRGHSPAPSRNNGSRNDGPLFAKSAAVRIPQNAVSSASLPIRPVALRTSANGSEITVPCVEADRYDPDFFRGSHSDDYAEQLRKKGHDVETVHEEIMFPLEDGRTIILPVETIDVHYNRPVQYQ